MVVEQTSRTATACDFYRIEIGKEREKQRKTLIIAFVQLKNRRNPPLGCSYYYVVGYQLKPQAQIGLCGRGAFRRLVAF